MLFRSLTEAEKDLLAEKFYEYRNNAVELETVEKKDIDRVLQERADKRIAEGKPGYFERVQQMHANRINLEQVSYKQLLDRANAVDPNKYSPALLAKTLDKARVDPLSFANRTQQIYYTKVNPAAMKSPVWFYGKKLGLTAVRYSVAGAVWGVVGLIGAYYILRPKIF